MPREKRVRALRLVPVLAALGLNLAGCGLPPDGLHGGGGQYSSPGYYGSPSYCRPPGHHRSSEHHKPRTENWSQQRLQQHWLDQAQRLR